MANKINLRETVPDPRYLGHPEDGGRIRVHIVIKATGKGHDSDKWIFNQSHRRKLLEKLKKYLKLAPGISAICATFLGNHGHIIFEINYDYKPTRSEIAQAYLEVYGRKLHPNSSEVHKLCKDASNLSKFMQRFCHDFAWQFNRNCDFKRTGHLWSDRYHSTVLKSTKSLLRCWLYVMFNPVKAGMCPNPLDYKFNTLTFDDQEFCNKCMQNFYEAYKEISDHKEVTFDDFRKMVLALLEEEVAKWEQLSKEQQKLYKLQNHYWEQAHVVGSKGKLEETKGGKKLKKPPHETDMPDQFWY